MLYINFCSIFEYSTKINLFHSTEELTDDLKRRKTDVDSMNGDNSDNTNGDSQFKIQTGKTTTPNGNKDPYLGKTMGYFKGSSL